MKKLMIATAAIALGASGAYATEGCCGIDPTTSEECKANVYQLKMTLKTLVPKTVTKNGCKGLYFEQGTRTIDGYIWTCCDPCGNLANTEDYQITLWEKAARAGILNGVGKHTVGGGTKYTVTVTYTIDGVKFTDTLSDEYEKTAVAAAVQAYVGAIPGAVLAETKATPVTAETSNWWEDADFESQLNSDTAPMVRFSKTANKAAVQFEVVGVGAETTELGDEDKYQFVAAGFGTFDAKSLAVKSVSGSVVGTLPSLDLCDDYANVADICDEFETWCDYADPGVLTIPAFGTWTAKYVKKMGSLYTTVPVYNRQPSTIQ